MEPSRTKHEKAMERSHQERVKQYGMHESMTEKQKNEILMDRRLVGCKWVFKVKRDGTHRARAVALRYS